jgi:hypothetical protein
VGMAPLAATRGAAKIGEVGRCEGRAASDKVRVYTAQRRN